MERERERERGGGGGLVSTPPKSITSAFVCDISGVCCHCHMASQGSLNWFRADTVIVDRGCSPFAIPSGALGLIPSETQPVTELSHPASCPLMEFRQGSGDYCHAQHRNA
ncbi:hypothetical protein IRJ41_003718 [Triplophysa rosa]|uniref:Uncharacterized protein n=1 Tax=Triplophysa rosa TaxID=992332 RepID=A0A9W8C329_TRIRA|nr:hypothetical protein IRJ41_003718 [Triplophysa rosa]